MNGDELFAHAPRLATLVAKMGVPQSDVDDIVQDTLTKAWEKRDLFDDERPLQPWLFTIARRLVYDLAKKRPQPASLDRPPTDSDPDQRLDHSMIDPAAATPHADAAAREEFNRALGYICELPPKQQAVVALHHIGGFPHRDVARILDVPDHQTRSASHRALRKLRGTRRTEPPHHS